MVQEYFLRLEPSEPSPPPTAETIERELRAHGFLPRHAVQVDRGWWLQAGAPSPGAGKDLQFPGGWRVVEERPVLAQATWPEAGESRAIGEIFTYALLLWPAVVGLLALQGEGWQLALKIALAVWLGLLHLVAYRHGRGAFFGNSLLMLSACVAAFWWTHPGPWMYLWLVVVVIGLYATVRGVLNGRTPLAGPARAPDAPQQQGNG